MPSARVGYHALRYLAFKSWPVTGRNEWISVDPARLFLSKQASRRARAAVLPSNGTRSVAPSPRTSRTSALLNLSLIERSISATVTAFDSANLDLRARARDIEGQ